MVEVKTIKQIEYNSKKERVSPSGKVINGDINKNSWMSIKKERE